MKKCNIHLHFTVLSFITIISYHVFVALKSRDTKREIIICAVFTLQHNAYFSIYFIVSRFRAYNVYKILDSAIVSAGLGRHAIAYQLSTADKWRNEVELAGFECLSPPFEKWTQFVTTGRYSRNLLITPLFCSLARLFFSFFSMPS